MKRSDLTCLTSLLILFNVFLAIFGVVMGVTGVIYIHYAVSTGSLLGSTSLVTPLLLTMFGMFLILTSFFGCCGASLPNKPLLVCFSMILMLLFGCQISLCLYSYANSNSSHEVISRALYTSMREYDSRFINRPATKVWDFVQTTLSCCGNAGAKDWIGVLGYIPQSCGQSPQKRIGCLEALSNTVSKFHLILLISSIGILISEVMAILIACCVLDTSTTVLSDGSTSVI